jgi:hypothetical protein
MLLLCKHARGQQSLLSVALAVHALFAAIMRSVHTVTCWARVGSF